MTTLDFPKTNTKETKIQAITMFISKAEKDFEYNMSREMYGSANENLGFINGLIEGRDYLTIKHFLSIDDTIVWAKIQLNIYLGNKDYGKCDYWQSYISGLHVCKAIFEG